jgi:V/A-type H+-transporting ATPase subunit B
LELGWELLSMIPESALTMISRNVIEKYHPAHRKS